MTGENAIQIGNSDWSLFYRMTNDKPLVNYNKLTGKFYPFDKCLFHKDIFMSQSLV